MITQRIEALRSVMRAKGLDAYIIPSGDPHQSEYVADHWKAREWISGFSGSAGTVVITKDHAGLWTDSRYFLQAEQQLKNTPVELHKLVVPHTQEHLEWLKNNLPEGSTVGFDGWLFSADQVRGLALAFAGKNIFLNSDHDLIGEIWSPRPAKPSDSVFELDTKYAGQERTQKIEIIRRAMEIKGTDYYLVSTLDDVAWLLNMRGSDVECNPLFIAYVVVSKEKTFLFIDEPKVDETLKTVLGQAGIFIKLYNTIESFLTNIPESSKILLDRASTSIRLYNKVPEESRLDGSNLVEPLKTIKNQTEIENIRIAMEKDGTALVRLFMWLEKELAQRKISEVEVAEKLVEIHRAMGNYHGESFSAIVGYQSNGAIVHYHPMPDNCAMIENSGILLLDCGAQYTEGTTDITRTVALSAPHAQQKKDYTLVLKGNLAVSMARFPKGTNGVQIDAFARQHLWRHNFNYGHGTGHGVGFFLCVHEGPQGFSPVVSGRSRLPIEPGMLTSNEPGLYRAGEYGIRVENLVLCVKDEVNNFGEFYKFETVSLFPFDVNLIETEMLDAEEKQWINHYHKEVKSRLAKYLNEEENFWLGQKCVNI